MKSMQPDILILCSIQEVTPPHRRSQRWQSLIPLEPDYPYLTMPYTLHLRRRICHFPLSALLPSRCHHTYSQIQGNTSRPRGISTIGKGSYYRASGFPKDTRPKDVFEVIQQQLLDHERQIHPEISVVPGCDHSSSSSTVAILKFTAQRPQFLLTLDEKPLSDVHIQFDSAQSRRGHITFDRHFHGFTQLYPTEEKHAITAE